MDRPVSEPQKRQLIQEVSHLRMRGELPIEPAVVPGKVVQLFAQPVAVFLRSGLANVSEGFPSTGVEPISELLVQGLERLTNPLFVRGLVSLLVHRNALDQNTSTSQSEARCRFIRIREKPLAGKRFTQAHLRLFGRGIMAGNSKQALVLSGGSIKGAYQAGAIAEILNRGFRPTAVYGISVGSINGGVLANMVGQQIATTGRVDLKKAGEDLAQYWVQNIQDFSALGERRSKLVVLWEVLFGGFEGMLKMDRLYTMLRRLVQPENLKLAAERGDLKFYAGALNLTTGFYYDAPFDEPRIVDYVIASTAMPIVMPLKEMQGLVPKERNGSWLDGGLHNVAPLSAAINNGYDDIVCVACRPKDISRGQFRGSLTALGERISDVIAQTLLDNDIEWAEKINGWIRSGHAPDKYREIRLTVVRPAQELEFDIETFRGSEISAMVAQGRKDAVPKMNEYFARPSAAPAASRPTF